MMTFQKSATENATLLLSGVSQTTAVKHGCIDLLPCGFTPPQPSQIAVTVHAHVCSDSYLAMKADSASNMDAKTLQILKC